MFKFLKKNSSCCNVKIEEVKEVCCSDQEKLDCCSDSEKRDCCSTK